MGTRYDLKIEKALHRQHRYLLVALLARDISETQRMELMSRINRLPFLWTVACGATSLYAEKFLPIDTVNEALQNLQVAFAGVKGATWYSALDQSKALSFTFPYQLYDSAARTWKFEKASTLAKFENLLLQIREAG